MRQIKFRVWDNEDNKYFEPIFKAYDGKLLDMSIGLGGDLIRRTLQFPSEHESCFKGRYELEQFTGLTDNNGVDIYEGDIVIKIGDDWDIMNEWIDDDERWSLDYPQKEVMRDVVSMDKFRYWLKNESFGYEGEDLVMPHDCEVIGNIHQNKDLLK